MSQAPFYTKTRVALSAGELGVSTKK